VFAEPLFWIASVTLFLLAVFLYILREEKPVKSTDCAILGDVLVDSTIKPEEYHLWRNRYVILVSCQYTVKHGMMWRVYSPSLDRETIVSESSFVRILRDE